MSYSSSTENLLSVLSERAPAKADAISANRRAVEHGLISVGLKLHIVGKIEELSPLIAALKKREGGLNPNGYHLSLANWCMVFGPVGSASTAIDLIQAIEQYCVYPIFNNARTQIQVCSPGRLDARKSAILAILFYLGSDKLRRYELSELETTFSRSTTYPRAKRFILYDAEGTFERNFEWWRGVPPRLQINSQLPFTSGRSDVLVGAGNAMDIRNINLVATLLVHAQYGGYWKKLGQELIDEVREMLERHMLSGLLDAPWVRTDDSQSGRDDTFFAALQELMAYAHEEATRVRAEPNNLLERMFGIWRYIPKRPSNDILFEVRTMLMSYHAKVLEESYLHSSRGDIR